MPTTMNRTVGAFVKYEAPQNYSRDDITVVSGQNLVAGTVLGKITASGKYTAWDPAAVDGSETAVGVLVDDVDASSGDAAGVMIARHAIVVDKSGLVFAGSPTEAQKDTAVADLASVGILSRTTV
ncbi:MAG: head decoration protein [Alphaproteobacteria bacterium]|nr:MAG: head decoration protein [Alphaproteobacteria bacterium]